PATGAPLPVLVGAGAAARAAALVPRGDGPLVGIAPGSVWATKRWGASGFAAVVRGLAEDGARCVILGAPDEAPLAESVRRRSGGGASLLPGRDDPPAVAGGIARPGRLRPGATPAR